MQKANLGISVGLLGAALYFLGIISIFPLVILAGYVLLYEQNEWLKQTAIKAVAIVIFFNIITTVINIAGNASSFLSDVFLLFDRILNVSWYTRILSIARTITSFLQSLMLLLCGFKALRQGSVKFNAVDNLIEKHK